MLLARRHPSPRRSRTAVDGRSASPRPRDPFGRRERDAARREAAAVRLWRAHGALSDSERPLVVSDLHAGDGRLSRVLRDAVYYAVEFRGYDPRPLAPDVQPVDLLGTLPPAVDVAFLLHGLEELPVGSELADRLAWHARWLVTAYAPPTPAPDDRLRREARGWRRHQSAACLAEELGAVGFASVAEGRLDSSELVTLWRQGR